MQKDLAAPYLPAALQGGRHLRHPLETDRRIDTLVRRAASATSPTDGSSSALRAGVQSIPKIGSSPGRRRTALDFLVSLSADLARGHVNVPGFPNVVMKIGVALDHPETSVDGTVRVVGEEPRLAARLLQAANSAAFNPTGARVRELRTAITRLGRPLVQGVTMAFAIQQMRDEPSLRSISNDSKAIWGKSIVVASLSRLLACRTKVKPDEAFLAGLLHGIGRLYIMARAVGNLSASGLGAECADLTATLHPSIGKALLENWRVGGGIPESVGDQANYGRDEGEADLTDVLIVGIVLAEALGRAPLGRSQVEGISSFRRIDLTLQECHTTLTHAEYHLAALHQALGC